MTDALNFDYVAWAQRLSEVLKHHDRGYLEWVECEHGVPAAQYLRDKLLPETDPIDIARLRVTIGFQILLTAIDELPAFQNDPSANGLTSLRHLLAAVSDLYYGNRSPLLDTRRTATRHTNYRIGQRQILACVGVVLYERAGLNNAQARDKVAQILGKMGLVGRQAKNGMPAAISAKTIFKWQADIEGGHNRANQQYRFKEIIAAIPESILESDADSLFKGFSSKINIM